MRMEQWWNDVRENSKYAEKILSQYHFVDCKTHINRSGIKAGSPRREAGDQQPVYSPTIIPSIHP
jgi:hypothetical protein